MSLWWESLNIMQQIFACIAIPATLILILQIILVFFGFGDNGEGEFGVELDNDIDADDPDDIEFTDDGLRLITLRGIVAFFAMTGWVGYALAGTTFHVVLTVMISVLSGLAAMLIVAVIFRFALKMQSDGTTDITNALGVSGSVYLSIPALRAEKGKVTIVLQGRLTEIDAVTDEESPLPYGTEIIVVGISNENTLVVERK